MHCCYTQPEKGWKTIVWLHVLLLFFGCDLTPMAAGFWHLFLVVFLSVLLSGICIQKRILPGSKKVLWCWTLLPYIGIAALAGSLFLRPQTYLYDRLLTALGLQHTDDGYRLYETCPASMNRDTFCPVRWKFCQ